MDLFLPIWITVFLRKEMIHDCVDNVVLCLSCWCCSVLSSIKNKHELPWIMTSFPRKTNAAASDNRNSNSAVPCWTHYTCVVVMFRGKHRRGFFYEGNLRSETEVFPLPQSIEVNSSSSSVAFEWRDECILNHRMFPTAVILELFI